MIHNFETIKKLNDNAAHVIAVIDNKVVGYALVMLTAFKNLVPVLVPMFTTFEIIRFNGCLT
ncbi:hypothetical protein [Aquimarina agarivorans]|uniref:hypothetical protein n=1 Tax=Aquimarina agarivorans TaxID=980584 RepID=UPI0002E6EF07|nr:hypothetical protein [Aquimarina agarivorans]